MTDMHSSPDRVVWFDLPVLEHGPVGNGGCLIPNGSEVSAVGILVYMNFDGRIRDAVRQAEKLGGRVLEPVKGIGPHSNTDK